MASNAAKAALAEQAPAAAPLPAGVELEQGVNTDDLRRRAYADLLADTAQHGLGAPRVALPGLPAVPRASGVSYGWVPGGQQVQVVSHVYNALVGGTYRFAFYGDRLLVDADTLAAGVAAGALLPVEG